MCDKKNSVLFIDPKCIVLSSDFKLPDENHVLLRVPRENNIYIVDLRNIVRSGYLTCVFAKATLDKASNIEPLVRPSLSVLSANPYEEAVNTACYVQNRVLVTKPHNKTPYELLLSKTPSIGFMRPFRCLVTILNTLDPSGKFNGKADEGFLVGYSVSSIQEHFDAKKAGEENVQQYVLFPLWSYGSKDPQNTDDDTTFEVKEPRFEFEKPESEVHVSPSSNAKTKKHDDKTKREAKGKNVRPTFGKSSYVDPSQYPDDPNMPALEDITYSDDEEHVGAEADFTNLETNITISPIPTTRVHKDYHVA
nr:retrovirus-related Pol polyprotein from transposon TNT 1-94 [Tanacetum cinerariifolium]